MSLPPKGSEQGTKRKRQRNVRESDDPAAAFRSSGSPLFHDKDAAAAGQLSGISSRGFMVASIGNKHLM